MDAISVSSVGIIWQTLSNAAGWPISCRFSWYMLNLTKNVKTMSSKDRLFRSRHDVRSGIIPVRRNSSRSNTAGLDYLYGYLYIYIYIIWKKIISFFIIIPLKEFGSSTFASKNICKSTDSLLHYHFFLGIPAM